MQRPCASPTSPPAPPACSAAPACTTTPSSPPSAARATTRCSSPPTRPSAPTRRTSAHKRVFFGGVNVYLQQKWSLFRHTPWFLDRLLDAPSLLRWVSRFAVKTQAEDLGDLTVSMLKGEHGKQSKEVAKLAAMAGGGGQAAGRQPHQRHPVRHGPRAEARRQGAGPLLAARRRHLPGSAAGAVPHAVAEADPRTLPRDRRLHRHQRATTPTSWRSISPCRASASTSSIRG